MKLAVIITHPIQYYSPLFVKLAKNSSIQLKVFYTLPQAKEQFYDIEFQKVIKWDIDLLDGYDYEFVKNISPAPSSKKFFGTINPSLINKIKKWKAEAILVIGWKHYSFLRAMMYFKGKIPVLFRGDSHLLDSVNNFRFRLKKKFLSWVYSFVDYALYVGKANKEYFKEFGLQEKQLIFAPHAIDNERFYDKNGEYEQKAREWREQLGFNDEDIVFLFAGKFIEKKNPVFLVENFLKIDNPNFKLLLVGNGPLENELKEMAKADKRIRFLPFQNQSVMPVVYRLGDVFLLPSIYNETWGLAINEAMASGRAVLASNKVGASLDLVKNNVNGFVFKANDKEDFWDKILRFNSENISVFGKNSLKIIKEYSFDKIVNAIEHIAQYIE